MKQNYRFSSGDWIQADKPELEQLLKDNEMYLQNYQEIYNSLEDSDFVARGNGFCDAKFSESFVDSQIEKYSRRIEEIRGWIAAAGGGECGMRGVRNYIFDFDGTLMDTAPVILGTMRAAIRELGLPERTEAECRATIGMRLDSIAAALFPDREGIGEEYASTYRRLFPQFNLPGVAKPFPHVLETLRALHAAGRPMAIASSRSHRSLVEFVDDMGLQGIFQMLVAGDDVTKAKPAPEPVLAILRPLGWKPEETLVVGDARVDILMGRAAGCRTCGVTYGNGTREELLQAQADFLVDDFGEIMREGE